MKLLKIVADVDPRGGGPAESIRQHSAYNAAAGVEEHVVSLDPCDAPWLEGFPVKLFALGKPIAWRSSGVSPLRRYGYEAALVPWLREHVRDYDVIIVHGLWNYATMGARRVLVGAGVPYLVFTHGMLDPWFKRNYPLKGMIKQAFWWFNEGPLLNNASYVLFTCEEERALAHGVFKPYRLQERVVNYGTADPGGDTLTQTAAFRARLPDLRRPYLLYLSRLHPKKGCDLLIDAFAKVCGPRTEFDLVMAGPGAPDFVHDLQKRASARGIASRVHWPGMLSGEAKWGAFRNALAFALPSHQENFGIVVAEAMACATPVLMTDKVNIWREVLATGSALVEPDNFAGVEALLRRFTALSPSERVEMGARARAAFLNLFEVDQACASFNAACQDAINGAANIAEAKTVPILPVRRSWWRSTLTRRS